MSQDWLARVCIAQCSEDTDTRPVCAGVRATKPGSAPVLGHILHEGKSHISAAHVHTKTNREEQTIVYIR